MMAEDATTAVVDRIVEGLALRFDGCYTREVSLDALEELCVSTLRDVQFSGRPGGCAWAREGARATIFRYVEEEHRGERLGERRGEPAPEI
eukprot:IDg13559t1